MRKTSVRELHIHTSELVREAADGGVIVIERRGEPVAELRPVSSPRRMPAGKKARIFASMRKMWARMPQVSDSTKILEEDRSREPECISTRPTLQNSISMNPNLVGFASLFEKQMPSIRLCGP